MKIAYLAPEIPALSATFVYNEILQLQKMGDDILPFSVRKPNQAASDKVLDGLRKNTVFVYENKKYRVLIDHFILLARKPIFYAKAFGFLIKDIISIGIFSRNGLGLLYRFFYAASITCKLLEHKCQHIHAHFAHVPGDLAMYAATMAGIKFSITAHANDIFERGWLLHEKAERAAFFATISEFNKIYLAKLGVNTEKIIIVRCGVDFELFDRRKFETLKDTLHIGAVCRLVEKKGIDTLIRAAAKLKHLEADFVIYIAGTGPLETELRDLTKQLDLSSAQVRFLGAMSHDQVSEFIKSLDIFVLPCKCDVNGDMDGIPVALMEAMALGVPVISSELSGIPELVINNQTGLLIQANDEQALADAILIMANNAELRGRLIENALNKVKTEFSLQINTQRLRERILSVL